MPPAPLKNPKHRRNLIYAGVAAAILLVVLIARRSSSASSATSPSAVPVSSPAVDPSGYYGGGSGAGGVDYSTQLASLDSDIQTEAQAIAALQNSAQNPGVDTPGTVGTDPTASLINAVVGAVSAGAAIASPAPSQPGPGNTPTVKQTIKPQTSLLAPGAKQPGYTLVRPKGDPISAKWSGPKSPGAGWKGLGGGWWSPPKK